MLFRQGVTTDTDFASIVKDSGISFDKLLIHLNAWHHYLVVKVFFLAFSLLLLLCWLKIHLLYLLLRGKILLQKGCPEYDTQQHLMVKRQLWRSGESGIPALLPLLPLPLWPGSVRVPYMGQIDVFKNHNRNQKEKNSSETTRQKVKYERTLKEIC